MFLGGAAPSFSPQRYIHSYILLTINLKTCKDRPCKPHTKVSLSGRHRPGFVISRHISTKPTSLPGVYVLDRSFGRRVCILLFLLPRLDRHSTGELLTYLALDLWSSAHAAQGVQVVGPGAEARTTAPGSTWTSRR